jgi:hypothetical protein
MPRKPKGPRLVLVHWRDAVAHHDPLEDESFGLEDCLSVGWVVEITAQYVKLAAELGARGDYREGVIIPKGMIVSITSKPFKLAGPFAGWQPAKPTK